MTAPDRFASQAAAPSGRTDPSARATHLFGLDLLRIVAAAMVLLNHFGAYGWQRPDGFAVGADAAFPALSSMVGTGAVGVEIFFVISGFVIAMSASGARPMRFATGRVIRIAPALWTCAVIALVARLLHGEPVGALLDAFSRSVILWPDGPYIDGVVWTLVVEAVFYGLVFLSMLAGPAVSLERLALGIGTASAAFVALFAYATFGASGPGAGELAATLDRFAFKLLLLRHGVFFAIGMLVFSVHRHGWKRWKALALVAFGAFALAEIAASAGGGADSAVQGGLWLVGLGAVVASVRYRDAIARCLAGLHGPSRELGRLSYPLYLNHYSLGMVLVPSLFAAGLGPPAALAVSLAIVIASSWWVVRVPERWGQRALRRLLQPDPAPSRMAAPAVPAAPRGA